MSINRLYLDSKATHRLGSLKARTKLNRNVIARVALLISLKEDVIPDFGKFDSSGMEMNRTTLTGDFDDYIISLIKIWLLNNDLEISDTNVKNVLTYHVNNGVTKMISITKNGLIGLAEYFCNN
ncbi:MAG: hypothetical protein HeimC3_48330 [Candidatus Heimdallarchaeota archaeon LC_3]|nr:MAG: hypothetical protein HeimC3_48330 [Candidatus Heimdallarchaeota archaeon LC_3]